MTPFLSHPRGYQPWLHFNQCLAEAAPGMEGCSPSGWDGSQGPFPNFTVKVLLVTQQALPVVLHRTAVQGESCR